MTAATLTHLPLAAGSAVAAGLGRALLWGIARYARAPLANTSILALTVVTAMAGSNALYFQHARHPAPLFSPAGDPSVPKPAPVTPATRTIPPLTPKVTPTTSAPAAQPAAASQPIGNAEVYELQRKLAAFGFFDGKIDGFYGPKTAGAIKRFEARMGLQQKGELTPEILARILAAPIIAPEPEAHVTPAPEPVAPAATQTPSAPVAALPLITVPSLSVSPLTTQSIPEASASAGLAASPVGAPLNLPVVMTEPVNVAATPVPAADPFQPLPAPPPLQLSLAEATQPAPLAQASRVLPDTPEEVLGIAVATAGNAVDAVVSVVENGVHFGPAAQPMQAMPAPLAAVPQAAVVQAAAMPAMDTSPTDPALVARIQMGLASLGFLHGKIDGVAGEATAKAIRNFEVYYNYEVTGRVSPQLLRLLSEAGAAI